MFPPQQRRGRLRLVGDRDGSDGAITIHQDAAHVAELAADDSLDHRHPGRSPCLAAGRPAAPSR
ncbi:MAG: hypothetical protein R3F55_17805 [Alphaproteobacteria bacterium]